MKVLWIVTTANAIVAILLVLVIYVIMLALAVLAPEISEWPLLILLAVGLPLSIAGVRLARGGVSRLSRGIAYTVNGSALAFNALIIIGLAVLFVSSTKERFLIPDGFKGDVYVIYSVPDGEAITGTRWEVTYHIPEDGILRTRGAMIRGWTRSEYYYVRRDGTLDYIRNFWCCTIDPTPENLTNDKDIGVYFPRTGRSSDASGCSIDYDLFYIGTKAHLLTKHKEQDLSGYLHDHSGACSTGQSK